MFIRIVLNPSFKLQKYILTEKKTYEKHVLSQEKLLTTEFQYFVNCLCLQLVVYYQDERFYTISTFLPIL